MTHDIDEQHLQKYFSDPDALLDDIDSALEALPVEDLPLVVLSADPAFDGSYRKVEFGGRPRHLVLEAMLQKSGDSLKQFVCVSAAYCEARKKHGDTVALVVALLDAGITAAIAIPLPVGTVVAYCVRSLFLDRLCGCGGGAQ